MMDTGATIADPTSTFRLGYRPMLDAIRGIAVIAVIFHHTRPHGRSFLPGGYLGVDVFFTLSGFLITTILLQEWRVIGQLNLPRFYARRALRLLPALLLWIAVLSVITLAARAFDHPKYELASGKALLAALAYGTNIVTAWRLFDLSAVAHTWSLAAEEQFYLVWPPVLVFLLRRKIGYQYIAISLVLLILASSTLIQILDQADATSERVGFGPDTRGGALLIGCVLSILSTSVSVVPANRRPWAVLGPVVASVLLAWVFLAPTLALLPNIWARVGKFLPLFAGTATACVIAWLVLTPAGKAQPRVLEPLFWIGRVSYGLYLWHLPVLLYGEIALPHLQEATWTVTMYGLTILLAAMSYYLVELPFLRAKARLLPEFQQANDSHARTKSCDESWARSGATQQWRRTKSVLIRKLTASKHFKMLTGLFSFSVIMLVMVLVFVPEASTGPASIRPLSNYAVAWDEANFASTMPASTQQCGAVKFRNTSEQMWLRSGIFISYHWYRDEPGGQRRQVDAWDGVRTALPHDIGPGQTLIADDVCVLTPSVPASYVLQLTLVQENVAWFETKGAETVEVLVTVQ